MLLTLLPLGVTVKIGCCTNLTILSWLFEHVLLSTQSPLNGKGTLLRLAVLIVLDGSLSSYIYIFFMDFWQKIGVEFPQRDGEHSVPIFTPPQSQPIVPPRQPPQFGHWSPDNSRVDGAETPPGTPGMRYKHGSQVTHLYQ